ncbi:hypothetical protein [Streptococcus danieliae]|uniref:hypothetical protein n=1 Tax=Streptococcus danieliae TaxID=747656 RepID=UPI0021C79F99|nr:hypothetical protein [Streptococcus danieliae]MCU0081845.1 hypothetical protein [Streptococcus danieliae]
MIIRFLLCKICLPVAIILMLTVAKLHLDILFYDVLGLTYAGSTIFETVIIVVCLYFYKHGITEYTVFSEKFRKKSLFSYIQFQFIEFPAFLKKYAFFNIILLMSYFPLKKLLDSIIIWINRILPANGDFDLLTFLDINGFAYTMLLNLAIEINIAHLDNSDVLKFNVTFLYVLFFVIWVLAYINKIDFDIADDKSKK